MSQPTNVEGYRDWVLCRSITRAKGPIDRVDNDSPRVKEMTSGKADRDTGTLYACIHPQTLARRGARPVHFLYHTHPQLAHIPFLLSCRSPQPPRQFTLPQVRQPTLRIIEHSILVFTKHRTQIDRQLS